VLSDRLFENGMICRLDDRAEPFVQIAPPLVAGIELFEEITEILRDGLTHAAEQLESGVPA
jgi:adenosylmethionine-8-amino-7-oxononanoate aminotransferase